MVFSTKKRKSTKSGRRSFKKRSFKRRKVSTKRRGSYKRKRTVSKKRKSMKKFSGNRHSKRMLVNPLRVPDEELVMMSSTMSSVCLSYPVQTSGSTIPIASYRFSMNNPQDPVTAGPFISINTCAGWTAQTLLYTNWQVRHAELDVKLDMVSTNLQVEEAVAVPPIDFMICPASAQNSTTLGGGTVTWDQLRVQAHCRRPRTIMDMESGRNSIRLKCGITPDQMAAIPGYYTQPSTWGTNTTAPTDTSSIYLYARCIDAIVGLPVLVNATVTVKYYVRWFNRKIAIQSFTEPERIITESKEEKEYDDISVSDSMHGLQVQSPSWSLPPPSPYPTDLASAPTRRLEQATGPGVVGRSPPLVPVSLPRRR
nr:MAG: capsid protein [Cressdnaviricota sp.]